MVNTNILIKTIQSNPERNWDFVELMKNHTLDLKFYITFREHVTDRILRYLLIFEENLTLEFFKEFYEQFSDILNIDEDIIPASKYIFDIMLDHPEIQWDYFSIFKDKVQDGHVTQRNIRDFSDKCLPWAYFNKNTVIDLDDSLLLDFPDELWSLQNKDLTHHISFDIVIKHTNISYKSLTSHPGLDINFVRKNKHPSKYLDWDYKELWRRGYYEIYYENLTPDEIEYYNHVSNIIRKYVVDWLYRLGNPGYRRLFERNKTFYQKSDN